MTEEFKPQSETNDRADKSQESASVLEPVEIGQEGESAQSAMAETKENEVIAEARTPKKKRHIARIVIAVLIVVMVGVGYLKRDSLFGGKAADEPAALGDQAKADLKVLYWVDPMHPNYKSDKPGKAPDCGMDLLPVYESGISPSNLPEGAFLINAEKQQLIGVTYGEVTSEQVSKTLRAVGRLAYDETKISHVHTKIEGWIEDVYVDFTGKPVKKGDPLLTIYSPELLQSWRSGGAKSWRGVHFAGPQSEPSRSMNRPAAGLSCGTSAKGKSRRSSGPAKRKMRCRFTHRLRALF
jgi:hypothetical protein